ncbi:MAG: hypothetical protein J5639_03075, partial [Bacteroidales bacterium]|nr:hypothetical protein [Bacteroidales bacterium]
MRSSIIPLLSLLLILTACNQELPMTQDDQQEARNIVFSLSQPVGDILTKTSYDIGENVFLWADGDAVGIVSPQGGQLKFTIKPEDYGKERANFDGRGFALKAGNKYASYYPFLPDFDLDPTVLPICLLNQIQDGENSWAHLGASNFSVAQGISPTAGQLDFTFLNVGSPHRYRLPVLAGTYTQLTIQIPSQSFTVRGTVNLMADNDTDLRAIAPTETTDRLTLELRNTTMASTGNLRCWMIVAPVNLQGSAITMIAQDSNEQEYVASVAGRDCPANTRRVFDALSSVFPRVSVITAEGGSVQIKVVKSAADVEVTPSIGAGWITSAGSSTDGLVTTYTYTVA